LVPSFVKRAKSERGRAHQEYLRSVRERVSSVVRRQLSVATDLDSSWNKNNGQLTTDDGHVTLVEYDPDAETKTVAAILYPHTDLPLEQLRALVGGLAAEERLAIIRAYVGERGSRFQRPGRAFEEPYYSFDILADLGAYRDL